MVGKRGKRITKVCIRAIPPIKLMACLMSANREKPAPALLSRHVAQKPKKKYNVIQNSEKTEYTYLSIRLAFEDRHCG